MSVSDPIVEAATRARDAALAPYSGFRVGAALAVEGGRVVSGCNIETASYGLTMCAERVALFTALAAGHRTFTMVAVVADTPTPTPPCGACRQLLWEYCGDIPVVIANLSGVIARHQLRDLLPLPFDGRALET